MRRLICFILFTLLLIGFVPAEASSAAKRDSFYANTEKCIKTIQQTEYGPYSTVRKQETDFEWLDALKEKLAYIFYVVKYVLIVIFVLLIILLLVFLVANFKGYKLFKPKHKDEEKKKVVVDMDSIKGRDFNSELNDYLQKEDFDSAIRVVYMYALSELNKAKFINWNQSKTPSEYYYEIKKPELKRDYYSLALIYLSVRFGNMMPSMELVNQAMQYLQNMNILSNLKQKNYAV